MFKKVAEILFLASTLNGEHTEIYCDVCQENRIVNTYHRLVECPDCHRILHFLPLNRRSKFAPISTAL